MPWTWQEKTYESRADLEEAKRRHYEAVSARYRAGSARRLRSIPPANRGLGRVSSMRAASHVGMTFVGGDRKTQQSGFTVKGKKPDPAIPRMREAFYDARRRLIEQVEALLALAEEEEEKAYWSGELERLRR